MPNAVETIVTRRQFLAAAAPDRVTVPLHRITDTRVRCGPAPLARFWSSVWPEAYRVFQRGGVDLRTTDGPGEIRRSAADRPLFIGLRRGAVNLVLTDHLPMHWEKGRARAGASTLVEGCAVCVVALLYAHGNQVPYLSVNTCVHEILHVLLQDIYAPEPKWLETGERELAVDSQATQLWLFGAGADVRRSARACLKRLAR
jgi:hypothetical protein